LPLDIYIRHRLLDVISYIETNQIKLVATENDGNGLDIKIDGCDTLRIYERYAPEWDDVDSDTRHKYTKILVEHYKKSKNLELPPLVI